MINIGIGLFGIGMILSGLATISFKIRALANKAAWGGITIPAGTVGLIALVIGLMIIIMNRG
ncbi:hypothetical protein [Lactiplantibacillus carotarum]|uniref:hypothetical protein n=1 Tax=Lactiplantibacillus carotarum TaxID=2993456 RepID=UPI00298EFE2D|nr:hypothetical protein [Lactiplantibacillus carotarum]